MSVVSSIDSSTLGISAELLTSSSTASSSSLDADDFLTLFLTQLQNQDPLDPMNTSELTSQTCAYSQLEQQVNTNTYLQELLQYQASVNNSQAVSLIGNDVLTESSTVSISGVNADDMVVELTDDAASLSVTIYDEDGQAVRTIDLGAASAGQNNVDWDGTGNNGETLSDGDYTFVVNAMDASGDSLETISYLRSHISSVRFSSGSTTLLSSTGQEISYNDVVQVVQS